ncbi:MAG: chromosomal replication initiator protein DnaA [Deltaproteobacteria bacterium]|nr:MAG: chromosomal replication initiator protein DnaA [Deltaproteobacteria bacterium]
MLWDTIKQSLLHSLPESEFGLWIKPLECRHLDEQNLELIGPDRFSCSWIQDHYLERIRESARSLGHELTVRINTAETTAPQLSEDLSGQLRLPGVTQYHQRLRSLHPAYTFDQFMVGESNQLAQSVCDALANGNVSFGNCLFMNSSPGLGKSHLTQAVVHQVLRSAPATQLQYLSAQQFSAEMVKSLRTNNMEQFSRRFINDCEMLLVEDVHTLVGKNKTQQELNMVLDYLLKSGRRVIMTSAVSPHLLKELDEDFRSRMSSGLVTEIQCPNYETRTRIIRHKARMNNLQLSEEQVDLLAQKLKGDIRRTESALMGLKAKSCLQGRQPDNAMVMEILDSLRISSATLDSEGIRDFVVSHFQVSVKELTSRSRKRSVTYPRQVAMFLSRKYTDESLADIGALYNRDHSTVLHAIKIINRDMQRKTSVREQLELLYKKLDQQ